MQKWMEELVYARADGRCEYCLLPDWASEISFAVDHVRAVQHGGPTTPENVALSCPDCNRRKGTNTSSFDPLTDAEVPLYNPRRQRWREHFAWSGTTIVGRTPTGRATVRLLDLNSKLRLRLRDQLPPLWRPVGQ